MDYWHSLLDAGAWEGTWACGSERDERWTWDGGEGVFGLSAGWEGALVEAERRGRVTARHCEVRYGVVCKSKR